MLEHLFGSRTRVKLLQLFLSHPHEQFFVRELTRKLEEHINSIRRELTHLEALGLVRSFEQQRKKYYVVDATCQLYPELRALVLKARLTSEKQFIQRLERNHSIQYLALLGYFVDDEASAIDMFIIGSLPAKHMLQLLEEFTVQFGHELRYTLMTPAEYHYRKSVTDKFLYTILQSPQLVLVNQLLPKP